MTIYTAGLILGSVVGLLVGFLVAYWLILGYVNGWWGNRP